MYFHYLIDGSSHLLDKYSRIKGNDYIRFLLDDYFSPKSVFEKLDVSTKHINNASLFLTLRIVFTDLQKQWIFRPTSFLYFYRKLRL